ncbi:uncharacterized protein LOC104889297 [Beta vulgaris subsp. vulgaris]|uniref:uncharacterized protein LOC104889297 n=1 Tax=Beta vulgaris subsp. vulgaris TaxID=3555 RepID=UPI002036CC33|nr:uncharacterized protein LOC104889297 [Beta vulgaris subsp. vulgaris]
MDLNDEYKVEKTLSNCHEDNNVADDQCHHGDYNDEEIYDHDHDEDEVEDKDENDDDNDNDDNDDNWDDDDEEDDDNDNDNDDNYDDNWDGNWDDDVCNKHQFGFKESYSVHPLSYMEKTHLEAGNKIILPLCSLGRLMDVGVDFPMLFKIENPESGKNSHCGVLEFSAEAGVAILPEWMMKNMSLEEGSMMNLESVTLDRATYIKLQPHSVEFLDIQSPRDVLEAAFSVGYSCLTVGDTIVVMHGEKKLFVDIVDAKPSNAVCIIETDVEVDFAPPLDYKEPEKSVHTMQEKPVSIEEELPKFVPFTGKARRLNETEELSVKLSDFSETADDELCENKNKPIFGVGKKPTDEKEEISNIGQTLKSFTGKSYRLMDS